MHATGMLHKCFLHANYYSTAQDVLIEWESLEKAVKDLVAFKPMATCYLDRVTGFKRTKETSGDVGV